jgi:hypothetical protein
MNRETAKHGPRLDEMLKRETRSLEQGAPVEARAAEDRLHEPTDHDSVRADAVDARTELSRHLLPSSFPGDREALIAGARTIHAPEDVIEALRRLPGGVVYATMHEVWVALDRPEVAEEGHAALRESAARDPLSPASS